VLWLLSGLAGSAQASENRQTSPQPARADNSARLDFDIPAQPLAAALKRYATHSNRPTLFRSEMVVGRTSSPVRGLHSPEAALRLLLEGTGLVAKNVHGGPADALILKEAVAATHIAHAGTEGVDTDYGAWVQARVWQALCADPRTVPGTYRSLLRFQVDAEGHIRHPRLLAATGDPDRDSAVLAALQRVRIDRSPPPALAQPLTMVVLPRDPGSSAPQCGTEAS
jgi:outer membrane biosynthesis protein TonB